ncbi:hypothetical protein NC653_017229 [Populus alba x Populus x berolinensis]|uniref:Uncharacterized protein n=1 Tax=Populus alba x Populus x berolinensis TaxID=444605 RepID=A0AAD6W0Q4_9ROSI|nr:hypothetical protein NC653_017229 [Populus alba x Populus x berolinensis]
MEASLMASTNGEEGLATPKPARVFLHGFSKATGSSLRIKMTGKKGIASGTQISGKENPASDV